MDDLSRAVEMLLTISKSEIEDRNPQQALAALLHAVRLTRGEDAIMDVLNQAKIRARDDVDKRFMTENLNEAYRISAMLLEQETMLSERGEQEILKDAFEDGSSVLCTNCGGLVARDRMESHSQYWCSAIDPTNDDECDD
mmetsp:Transcript_18394/g.30824  ORF Transcript_18394/g.30824 Transcript_18394/m.30824 type:complete len:140 (+) Transcript_18394:24-443(+)